ncbi:MAG: ATP-binding protein [Pseudomonadota bacterium]|uniref:histidine kinase n=1 Tax=Candidatus Desulfatibia profunda TaxID=2841695 RepID=A0A8J6TMC8_9BACT|nr:histidine kinase [Candidatus Desulfatibia profunda]MBL7180385.1 histidine kinase [Desulfobacterales bacterium]
MWTRISFRHQIYLLLTALMFITLLGALFLVRYTYRMEDVLAAIIDKDLAAFESAASLETALVNQKGFVSYYFMDSDPEWLRKLGEFRQIFKQRISEARLLAETPWQKEAIHHIDQEYQIYIQDKDRVIDHYKAGEREIGLALHQKVRDCYFKILDLCEAYKDFHRKRIIQARQKSLARASDLRFMAATAVVLAFMLGFLIAFVMARQILDPLRRLALETDREESLKEPENEIKAVSRRLHGLIEDAGQTHIELERSREHLLQAEKMALVGKLAAGVAHSIRNPLTSVKMRLFSLSRSLELNDYQKEDFEVISEEIRHTDTIVQNFLEFARPPKLKMQPVSPSAVVDQTLLLMEHRLKSYDVNLKLVRKQPLPEIEADPEQLKEVFANLIENACEAIGQGGSIMIEEETGTPPACTTAVIRVRDNGPGISEAIQHKLFEPFFTTKEEGTGLGLSIAARIVEEHRGRLEVTSKEGEGATFIITLPLKDSGHEKNSDH